MYFAGTSDHKGGSTECVVDLEKKGGVWKGVYLCKMTVAFQVTHVKSQKSLSSLARLIKWTLRSRAQDSQVHQA
jgi:phage-related protein